MEAEEYVYSIELVDAERLLRICQDKYPELVPLLVIRINQREGRVWLTSSLAEVYELLM